LRSEYQQNDGTGCLSSYELFQCSINFPFQRILNACRKETGFREQRVASVKVGGGFILGMVKTAFFEPDWGGSGEHV